MNVNVNYKHCLGLLFILMLILSCRLGSFPVSDPGDQEPVVSEDPLDSPEEFVILDATQVPTVAETEAALEPTSTATQTDAPMLEPTTQPAGFLQGELAVIQIDNIDEVKEIIQVGSLLSGIDESVTAVRAVTFSPKGDILAAVYQDQTVRLWDLGSGELLSVMEEQTSFAFSPNGEMLALGGSDHNTRLVSLQSGELIGMLEGEGGGRMAFSPDGSFIALQCRQAPVCLWDINTDSIARTLEADHATASNLAFSPDGSLLATSGYEIHLWDVSTGDLIYTKEEWTSETMEGHFGNVYCIAYSHNGEFLATCGGYDQHVILWEASSGQLIYTMWGHESEVNSAAFSPDDSILASVSGDTTISLWEVSSGDLLTKLVGHTSWVYSVDFSPDGKLIATGSDDGSIRLWGVPLD